MNPMNGKRLDNILDRLAEIGKRKVSKGNSLLSSINIKDDMIKIAAKQVALDPIEKKLRTGYVRPISKERPYMVKMATQFTELPPSEKEFEQEKKKTNVKPSSAMGKYPSGSEQTTPYVGEQHGGDQVPAASTLAQKKAGSSALKQVIRELVQENQIFIDVNQLVMRLNQKGQQSDINIDNVNKSLADNGITLIKRASSYEDIMKGQAGDRRVIKVIFDNGTSLSSHYANEEECLEAIKERSQSFDTKPIWWIENGKKIPFPLEKISLLSNQKRAYRDEEIKQRNIELEQAAVDEYTGQKVDASPEMKKTLDHLIDEEKEHRDELEGNKVHAGLNVQAKSLAEIKERLESARDSRSYHAEMLQEKDLDDSQKDKHQKAKRKWEKEINRLDREFAKALRQERKEEKEEKALEKAEQEARELTPAASVKKANVDDVAFQTILEYVEKELESDWEQNGFPEVRKAVEIINSNQPNKEQAENVIIEFAKLQLGSDWELGKFPKEQEALSILSGENEKNAVLNQEARKQAGSQYEQGDRVELIETSDIYSELLPGTQGTVQFVDDTGTVHVNWDDGSTLGMVLDAGDKIKLIGDMVEAKRKGNVVTAQEPIIEPSFELEKFLSPAEYQEMQRLIDLRQKTWGDISDREERNIQEGLAPYANIDYSEVELYNDKIQQYQELAKSRKSQNVLPNAPEAEQMPPMPEMGAESPTTPEMPLPDESKGVLEKDKLPEFASSKGKRMERMAKKPKKKGSDRETNESDEKRCNSCDWEFYSTYGTGECPECGSEDWEYKLKGMDKKSTVSQDIPYVCKNCKDLVVPAGYNRLTFLDHKVKPFCSIADGNKDIGFRYAYARECMGYNPIMKEVKQNVETATEIQFEEMKDNGVKSVLERKAGIKKSAEYEDKPKNEPATIDTKEDAEKRGKAICEKCMQYFIPRGQKHMTQDWHSLWDIPYQDVNHVEKGTCLPRSMSYQSQPEGGPNQFDTDQNRIVQNK